MPRLEKYARETGFVLGVPPAVQPPREVMACTSRISTARPSPGVRKTATWCVSPVQGRRSHRALLPEDGKVCTGDGGEPWKMA